MTRRDLLAPLAFLAAAALAALAIAGQGLVFLPKHPSATPPGADPRHERIVPYGAGGRAEAVAAEPFNFPKTDPINLLGPDLVVAARRAAAGEFPLWNPDVLCGAPHAANPITGVFYPPTWLALQAPLAQAPLVLATLHAALAAIFFFVYLRAAGACAAAAAIAGTAGALSGFLAGRVFNFVVVDAAIWIPLALAGVEGATRGRRLLGASAIALSFAMMFAAGFPQFAILGVLATACYAGCAVVARALRRPNDAVRSGGAILGGALLGFLLAAPLLVPAAELRAVSARGQGGAVESPGLAPGAFALLVAPGVVGGPYDFPPMFEAASRPADFESRRLAARLLLGRRGADGVAVLDETTPSHSEAAIYPGAAALLLLVFGLCGAPRAAVSLGLLLALGVAYATRAIVPPPALAAMLGLDVGGPGRGVLVFAFAPAALLGFAVDALLRAGPRPLLRGAAVLLALLGALPGAVALVAPERFDAALFSLLAASGAGPTLGAPAAPDPAVYAPLFGPAFALARSDLARFAGAAVLAALAAALSGRRRALAVALFLAAVVADLGPLWRDWVRPIRASDPYPETPALRVLRERAAEGRIARLGATEAEARADVHRLLPPNCGLQHGLSDAQGYREPAAAHVLDYFRGLASFTASAGTAGFSLAAAAAPALDVAGVKFFLATRALESEPDFAAAGLRRVPIEPAEDGDLVVYENLDVLPRAFAVSGALTESRPASRPNVVALPLAYRRPQPERVEIEIETAAPATLVFPETFDRGWRVSVGDGPFELPARAYGAFLAAPLPGGRVVVRFRYLPYGWRAAPYALAAAAGLLVVSFAARLRRRRRGAAAASAPDAASAPPVAPASASASPRSAAAPDAASTPTASLDGPSAAEPRP